MCALFTLFIFILLSFFILLFPSLFFNVLWGRWPLVPVRFRFLRETDEDGRIQLLHLRSPYRLGRWHRQPASDSRSLTGSGRDGVDPDDAGGSFPPTPSVHRTGSDAPGWLVPSSYLEDAVNIILFASKLLHLSSAFSYNSVQVPKSGTWKNHHNTIYCMHSSHKTLYMYHVSVVLLSTNRHS